MSSMHGLWQRLPHGLRRRVFDRATLTFAPRLTSEPVGGPPWIIAGAFGASTGLGEAARLAAEALTATGEPVSIVDLTDGLRQSRSVPLPSGLPDASPGESTVLVFANPPVSALALRLIPRAILAGRRRIGCFVWELERTPPNWPRHAAMFHEIAAPSRFAAEAIAHSLGQPVRVLPHPVATSALPEAGPRTGPFTAGFIGDTIAAAGRKNPGAVIEAFRRAALPAGEARLQLVLHGPAVPLGDIPPGVEIRSGCRSRDAVRDLYAGFDLYVSLHRAEGFGLTVAETMLAGVPAVATDWSATREFLDAATGWPVPCRLVPSPPSIDDPRQHAWADPDLDAAAAAIREAHADAAGRRRRGAAARARVTHLFSAAAFRSALYVPDPIRPEDSRD